jgi:mannose-1-phosphate guanylyltransferase / phosphomannomutase
MRAIIMAGGFGTRLRPLTANLPKPMVPMMNKPMIEHIISLLKRHGLENIVVSLFFQPDAIINYFGDGSSMDVKLNYVKADTDYGTAGSVRNAISVLGLKDEQVLIISGDVLTDINLSNAIEFHNKRKSKATIVLTRSKNPLQFGIVITNEKGKITRFLEKPTWGEVFSDTINTGIYILEPEVLNMIPYREEFDFSKDLFPAMLEKEMGLYGYITDGYWRDVGNLNEYQEAHFDCLAHKVELQIDGNQLWSSFIGEGTTLKTKQENLIGNVCIGKNCIIEENVKIFDSVIGDYCRLGTGSIIRNSVIWNGTHIGKNSELSSDVIGFDCVIGDMVTISDNVFISDKCKINHRARLLQNIKLWPEKIVEESAVLNRSLVLEDRWLKEIFTDARVTGLSNIDMNPEFGARLGAAFGTVLGEGKTVVTSRDSDNVSRMVNRAIICGLMSTGVNINDMRTMPIPLVRHELSSGNEAGGIHVRKSPLHQNMTDIIFFDSNGKDLPTGKTKSVERIFFGEDLLRAHANKVGSINFIERTTEVYRQNFLATINLEAVRKAKFKIVLDYSNGVASTIFPTILGSLNCQAIALNAHLDPRKLTREQSEIDESLKHISHIVTSLKYDLGCMIDSGAERITIVDEKGNIIENERLLTLVIKMFLELYPQTKRFAVPISSPSEIDEVSKQFSIPVVKTKSSHLAMMEAASDKSIGFVGGTRGGFIFTDFFFASDGMYSLAKILGLLAASGQLFGTLNENVLQFSNVKRSVACAWDKKGQVMRHIMKYTEGFERQLIDGVRIKFDEKSNGFICVQMLPDKEKPIFHIIAEAKTNEAAEKLADEYSKKINERRDAD